MSEEPTVVVEDDWFRTGRRWSQLVVILLELWVAFAVASIAAGIGRLSYLGDFERSCLVGLDRPCGLAEGRAFRAVALAINDRRRVLLIVFIVLLVATAAAWTIWQHRAHRTVREKIGAYDLRFTPGWGAGCWYVPFANLVVPYQAVSELWRASDADRPGLAWPSDPAPWRIRLWWAAWLITGLAGRALLLTRNDNATGEAARRAYRTFTIGALAVDAGSIVAAVLAILVVVGIQGRQQRAVAKLLLPTARHRAAPAEIGAPQPDDSEAPILPPPPSEPAAPTTTVPEAAETPRRTRGILAPAGLGALGAGIVAVAAVVMVFALLPEIPSSAFQANPPPAPGHVTIQPLPSGWHLYSQSSEGFAIGLPGTWATETPGRPSIKLQGYDAGADPSLGYSPTMAVAVAFAGTGVTLDEIGAGFAQAFQADPNLRGSVTRAPWPLPAGPAERIDLSKASGSLIVDITEYLLLEDGALFVITFGELPEQRSTADPVFDRIAQSFRFA